MKTQAFVITMLFTSASATCYAERDGDPREDDCICHESCATCGYSYYDLSEQPDRCITCAEGQGFELQENGSSGIGVCVVPGPEACYDQPGDETPIPGC